MLIIIYILFGVAFFLMLLELLMYSALNKLFRYKKFEECILKISVIVAAKNEVNNIPNLISSLVNQSYSKDNFEVIIVDDNSDDDTFEVATELTKNLDNFSIIKANNKIFEAKKGALDLGIKSAKNPFILITDADCEPEKKWIYSFAVEFENKYDFLFGIAPYKATNSFTNLISRFENLRANFIVFAFAKLSLPYSASARSLGFSREAFNEIYGYKNTLEALSGDDDLLIREALKNNFSIGMVTDSNAFVFSKTKEKFSEYVNQKARHTSTSIYYSNKNKVLLSFWHILNIIRNYI